MALERLTEAKDTIQKYAFTGLSMAKNALYNRIIESQINRSVEKIDTLSRDVRRWYAPNKLDRSYTNIPKKNSGGRAIGSPEDCLGLIIDTDNTERYTVQLLRASGGHESRFTFDSSSARPRLVQAIDVGNMHPEVELEPLDVARDLRVISGVFADPVSRARLSQFAPLDRSPVSVGMQIGDLEY